jgi:hypothetical protein
MVQEQVASADGNAGGSPYAWSKALCVVTVQSSQALIGTFVTIWFDRSSTCMNTSTLRECHRNDIRSRDERTSPGLVVTRLTMCETACITAGSTCGTHTAGTGSSTWTCFSPAERRAQARRAQSTHVTHQSCHNVRCKTIEWDAENAHAQVTQPRAPQVPLKSQSVGAACAARVKRAALHLLQLAAHQHLHAS